MNVLASLAVFGCGGHAKVVIDAAEKAGTGNILVADDAQENWGKTLMGYPILGGRDALLALDPRPAVIVGIGDNHARMTVAEWLAGHGFALATVIHPSAQIGRGARIGTGCFIAAGAVVNSDAVLGENVIVNTGACVDHDCVIGEGVHIAPGCHLCGNVKVGAGGLLGVGVSVIPGVRIGDAAMIAAGAVVSADVPDGASMAGVPARPMRRAS